MAKQMLTHRTSDGDVATRRTEADYTHVVVRRYRSRTRHAADTVWSYGVVSWHTSEAAAKRKARYSYSEFVERVNGGTR